MPPAPGAAKAREQLVALLTPVIERAGFDLDDVSVTTAGRRSLVRIVVDADGGIDLDSVADVSRLVSDALDGDEFGSVLPGAYTLEVTSPGVDRPLTEPRHWRRAAGRLVAVELDGRPVTARVVSADPSQVVLDLDGARRSVGFTSLGRGRVQVEFNRGNAADGE